MSRDDDCPVADDLIGRLYASTEHGLDDLISGVPTGDRGLLALFCYRRAHLHNIGIAIAATCDLESLIDAGGRAGNFLFDLSRERPNSAQSIFRGYRHAKITLATCGGRDAVSREHPIGRLT
jgi:hypothetical protein